MKISLEQRLRAAGGPPAYMRRKRRIEDLEKKFTAELSDVYTKLVRENLEPHAIRNVLIHHAGALDLALLNDLIEKHNRYYPIEANLRVDVKTRRVMDLDGPFEPLTHISAESLVARILLTNP
ncbi:MAG: hypothetical protein IPK82_21660 [Polyangiaceae bacterium]|nr:hypothetical protein [Polyangiaceae bacterium]